MNDRATPFGSAPRTAYSVGCLVLLAAAVAGFIPLYRLWQDGHDRAH